MLCLVGLKLKGGDLLDLGAVSALGFLRDPHLEHAVTHGVLNLEAIVGGLIDQAVDQLFQLIEREAEFDKGRHHVLFKSKVLLLILVSPDGELVHLLEKVFLQQTFGHDRA